MSVLEQSQQELNDQRLNDYKHAVIRSRQLLFYFTELLFYFGKPSQYDVIISLKSLSDVTLHMKYFHFSRQ